CSSVAGIPLVSYTLSDAPARLPLAAAAAEDFSRHGDGQLEPASARTACGSSGRWFDGLAAAGLLREAPLHEPLSRSGARSVHQPVSILEAEQFLRRQHNQSGAGKVAKDAVDFGC